MRLDSETKFSKAFIGWRVRALPVAVVVVLSVLGILYSWRNRYPWGMFSTVKIMDMKGHVYLRGDWGTREGWFFVTDKPYKVIVNSLAPEARRAGAPLSERAYDTVDENGDVLWTQFDKGKYRLEVRVSNGRFSDLSSRKEDMLPGTTVWIARDWDDPGFDPEKYREEFATTKAP